jgi:hypothetical protein
MLGGMMGRPGIAKVKWLGLRPVKAIVEQSGIVLDSITRKDIRVIDRLKMVALQMGRMVTKGRVCRTSDRN